MIQQDQAERIAELPQATLFISGEFGKPMTPVYTAEEVREVQRKTVIQATKASMELAAQVNDLSMLMRRLVHALNRASPNNPIAKKAADYLIRNGLQGSPLRAEDVLREDRIADDADGASCSLKDAIRKARGDDVSIEQAIQFGNRLSEAMHPASSAPHQPDSGEKA
jgi:hypothetical protein